MANHLKMAMAQAILQLHALGWSFRRIAKQLHLDRETVSRHVRLAEAKATTAPTGSELARPEGASGAPVADSKPATAPTGSAAAAGGFPVATELRIEPPRRAGQSRCEPHRELILAKLEQGLSAQRIYQDLVAEHGFGAKYWSVRRFVEQLAGGTPLPFRRLESLPGGEAQVDFGTGAPVLSADGKRRKTHVFRIVLSSSRKGYSEATSTQTTDDFLRALENAFRHFGGVPKTLVIDNLKAAVAHPDWFDPELTPKVQAFARHYGTVILPTKPYTPRHKGKIEAGVKYVKNNALKGRTFASLEEQQRHLAEWEAAVADTRIHGTTKQQVKLLFEQERTALLPLPLERFACFHEGKRKVNRDGHVEVAKAYYSAPPEYLGREVWVRWDARLVRLFNHRFEQIAVHTRHEQGRFSTNPQHLAKEKISGIERGAAYLLHKVSVVGPFTRQWSEAVVNARGIEGTRVLQGLLSLTKKHPCEALEKACEIALSHGCWRLRAVRQLLGRKAAKQEPLPFLEEHPIIRPMSDYGAIVAQASARALSPAAIHCQDSRSSMSEGFTRHDWTKERPGGQAARQGAADVPPPRSGYPSAGCSSAEPASVSPDNSTVVPTSSFHQEHFRE
jgi:transposase